MTKGTAVVVRSYGLGKAGPQISPLRCAPVEMTKGRAALPLSVVAEQDPLFIALGGPKAHDSSGRKTLPREGPLTPQISPLRCAPVEMTKGRAALPATVVAEQEPFFITSVETFPRKGPLTPQISPLRCAPVEMTKGRAALPTTAAAEQDPFFITSVENTFPRKDRRHRRSLHYAALRSR